MPHRPVCLSVVLGLATALAADAPKEKAKEEAPKPTTHTVKAEHFKIEAQLKGVLEAPHAAEIVFRPLAWGELTVLEAAPPGKAVKKGDAVITLDTERIDDAIKDAEAALAAMEPALKTAAEELAAMEKTLEMDLAAAERAKKHADEDLKRYTETDRPSAVKQANFSVKSAENYLAYQREELRQLEKMYKADDLVEETEEIILKRQRDAVERAEFSLELARQKAEQTLKVDLPRQDIATAENAARQAIALPRAMVAIPAALARKRLEVEKLKTDQTRAAERLVKLKKDRATMTATAPADGLVYMGPCVRGTWPRLGQTLERGAQLKPHDVVMTIVQPVDIFVRVTVPEEQVERVASGASATISPVGFSNLRLKGKVEAVSPVPVTPGNFEARLAITLPKDAPPLMPGMNATVKVVSHEKKDALTVPVAALLADDADEDVAVVYVRKPDGSHEKRSVTVGRRAEGKAEVLKGISAGEVVLLERPEK